MRPYYKLIPHTHAEKLSTSMGSRALRPYAESVILDHHTLKKAAQSPTSWVLELTS